MYFPFLNKIYDILNNITNFLLKLALILSGFFIIYLGIKTYFASKNFGEIKRALIYLILGLVVISLIFLDKDIILKTIQTFVPSFK